MSRHPIEAFQSAPTTSEQEPRPHLVDVTMYWSTSGGGVARYLRDKRRWAISRAGWKHTWVVPGECDPPHRRVRGVPIPGSGGYRFPLMRTAAARLLADLEPDLIEAGDPFRLAWSSLDAAQARGIPVVSFCHSNPADLAGRWFGRAARNALRRYLKHVYQRFDAVLAASRWMVDEARNMGLDNVVHQPLGVNLAMFNPSRRDLRWRERLGIGAEKTLLIYVGRFAREKNLPVLGDLMARLGSDYVLIALGGGPLPPRGDRVLVLPYARDPVTVSTAMASADVFVHAGESETFGLAALEALACGTPVVMPARAGLLDLVDGKAAIGVSNASGEALAEGVRAFGRFVDERVRSAAAEAARPFDQEVTLSQLFARYAALRSMSAPADRTIGGLRLA